MAGKKRENEKEKGKREKEAEVPNSSITDGDWSIWLAFSHDALNLYTLSNAIYSTMTCMLLASCIASHQPSSGIPPLWTKRITGTPFFFSNANPTRSPSSCLTHAHRHQTTITPSHTALMPGIVVVVVVIFILRRRRQNKNGLGSGSW